MLKKIGCYFLGFFTALIAALAGVWAALKFAQPTTAIHGKVKAKKGSSANLTTINSGKKPRRKKRLKFKRKRDARIF